MKNIGCNVFILVFSLVASSQVVAQIFNGDDRMQVDDVVNGEVREVARSVVALVPSEKIKRKNKMPFRNRYQITATSLAQEYHFCAEAKFNQEQRVANCSGALIGEDLVLTAAHCINENLEQGRMSCSDYHFVFDYKTKRGVMPKSFLEEQVYRCKSLVYHKLDMASGEDLAIVRLDRKVKGRKVLPVKLSLEAQIGDEIYMLGFPLGIPMKYTQGHINYFDQKKMSFVHDLDAFSVNSGSPVFNAYHEIIGVLVRGTGANYSKTQNGCYDWAIARPSDSTEANTLETLLKVFKNSDMDT